MIGFLSGKIIDKEENSVVLNVNNIGYLLYINQSTGEKLPIGSEASFFTYMAVRENDISLFGLLKKAELSLFKLLISVKGIGPKSALEMLNVPIETLKNAIAMEDDILLSQTPGVGKKTAQRIIVELKGKISDFDLSINRSHQYLGKEVEDATFALINLGYKKHFIAAHLNELPAEINNAEAIIRHFLSNVSNK